MRTQFVKDLKQFALAVDIVNEKVLQDIGLLLSQYFLETLRANTFDIRVEAPSGTDGERFMQTLWTSCGREYTTKLRGDDGNIRGHTSYAVIHGKPLWVISASVEGKEKLSEAEAYRDIWSEVDDLPLYRGWGNEHYSTSVIVPIGQPAIGFLNLEFDDRLEVCSSAKEELLQVTEIINIFYELYKSHKIQASNTTNAVKNLNATIPHSPLLKPKIFFAFSSHANQEVVGIIKEVLGTYRGDLDIVSWDEIRESGNINVQIANTIGSAAFGICYLSEPTEEKNRFQDNFNVVFEAGMFHALSSNDLSKTRWIPIREENSESTPFDFASDRLLVISRTNDKVNEQVLNSNIRGRINASNSRSYFFSMKINHLQK